MSDQRFVEIINAYYEGDKVAIMVVEGCLGVVTDLGFARNNVEKLDEEHIDYYELRQDSDEDIDLLSRIISEHFNIKGALEEHVEGVCECSTEQMFEYQCGCEGDCSCEGNNTINVIPFPKKGE